MSELTDKIRSRGYWEVSIFPNASPDGEPRISELFRIVDRASVEIRGWDYPHMDRTRREHIDIDWVGQESEWEHAIEAWRAYKTGLFTDLAGFARDWRDQSRVWPPDGNWSAGDALGVGEAIYRYSEVFLFASRLAHSDLGSETMTIEIAVNGLEGRRLEVDSPNRIPMHHQYVCQIDRFPSAVTVSRAELSVRSWELALETAAELFERFGWDPGLNLLESWQAEIPKQQEPGGFGPNS